MAKQKECAVEKYFNDRVKETGGETRKVIWPGRKGAPDRLAGWPRHRCHAVVELKSREQSWGLQPAQKREIDRLLSWGFDVWVIDSKEQVDLFIVSMTGA